MLKRILIMVVLALQLWTMPAYALSSIKFIDSGLSEKELVVNKGDKLLLTKEWYHYKFEINENIRLGTVEMKAVDGAEYEKALAEVQFPLEAVGDCKIYFMCRRLKNYPSALALSFPDGSTVVFGTYYTLSAEKIHQLAVHELGHLIDFRLMNEGKWKEYLKLRGLTDTARYNNAGNVYENRPQEIFAEDFRLLFGGDTARKIPHLNKSLPHPQTVQGLKEFYLSLLK